MATGVGAPAEMFILPGGRGRDGHARAPKESAASPRLVQASSCQSPRPHKRTMDGDLFTIQRGGGPDPPCPKSWRVTRLPAGQPERPPSRSPRPAPPAGPTPHLWQVSPAGSALAAVAAAN